MRHTIQAHQSDCFSCKLDASSESHEAGMPVNVFGFVCKEISLV